MEISSLSQENYKFKTKQTIKVIASVYVGLTILAFIMLRIVGMGWYDAINHAFSVMSTGGFSTKNYSIYDFHSYPIEAVISLFMFLASVHFGLIYISVTTRSFKICKSPVIRFYFATVVIATLIIAINIKLAGNVDNIFTGLRQSLFMVLSMVSTTGFAVADTTLWPSFSILLLMYLCFQCGCSGSTSGGIKSDRVLIFIKSFFVQLKRHVHPNAVVPVRVGNHTLEKDAISSVSTFINVYLFILIIGVMVYLMTGMDFIDSVSSAIAHMGNVGPAFGTIGVFDNYDHIPFFAKFISTILMLLGRLEIYPLLIIFVIYKWR